MPEQNPITRHDPYPAAEDRRDPAVTAWGAALNADLAAQPKAPSHIVTTGTVADGLIVRVADGHDTAVLITQPTPGRLSLSVDSDNLTVPAFVEFPIGAATAIVEALAAVAGLGTTAPIVGHR